MLDAWMPRHDHRRRTCAACEGACASDTAHDCIKLRRKDRTVRTARLEMATASITDGSKDTSNVALTRHSRTPGEWANFPSSNGDPRVAATLR
jgi:hypothetical protein